MKNCKFLPLPPEFKILVNANHSPLKIQEITKKRIEEIWKQEIVRTEGKLFNGSILCVHHFDGKQLEGHFVEYKHYIAQLRDPSLFSELHLELVCICSYTHSGEHILFGKRSLHVTDYPGFFELVPAGGVDPSSVVQDHIDIIKQVKIELKEEAGIEEWMIEDIHPSYLIIDQEANTYEICSKITLHPSISTSYFERDEEYTEVQWVSKQDLPTFIEKNKDQIIPLSLEILNLFDK